MAKKNTKPNSVIVQESAPQVVPVTAVTIPWKSLGILSVALLCTFFLHLSVFSDLQLLLDAKTDEFLPILHMRSFKIALLVILALTVLVMTNKLVKHALLSWIFNGIIWIFIFLYAGEFWFNQYPCSQGNGEAYVAQVWFKKYWKKNQFGFRDRNYNLMELADQRVIFNIGDSYVAGHGIKDPEDRTSNLLEKALNNKYYVVNAGTNGSATQKEYELLRQFPVKPEIVIFSHVTNDIEEIMPKDETYLQVYINTESGFSDWVYDHSRNSILLDLVYHYIKSMVFANAMQKQMKADAKPLKSEFDWYKDSAVFMMHMRDIQKCANYVIDTMESKLIFITYPDYDNTVIDSSDLYVNRQVIKHLEPHPNLYILNATPLFKTLSNRNRRVNMLDGHPSVDVNRLVADSLHKIISGWDKPLQ